MCAATVADHTLQQGQGMHGNFSRANTKNFDGCNGPDFRAEYTDPTPASNADVGMTLAHILGLKLSKKGDLIGRVLSESLKEGNHQTPQVKQLTRISEPAKNGLQTVLLVQAVGNSMYFMRPAFPAGRWDWKDWWKTGSIQLQLRQPLQPKKRRAQRHRFARNERLSYYQNYQKITGVIFSDRLVNRLDRCLSG